MPDKLEAFAIYIRAQRELAEARQAMADHSRGYADASARALDREAQLKRFQFVADEVAELLGPKAGAT